MQALLLSPATTFLSPDSSSSLSPSTPPLPSLDFLNHIDDEADYEPDDDHERDYTRERGQDTPTHAPQRKLARGQQQQHPPDSGPATASNARRTSIPPVPLTTPRVPSNLRYAFNANEQSRSADQSTTSSDRPSPPPSPLARSPSTSASKLPPPSNSSFQLIEFDQSSSQLPLSSLSPNTSSTSSAAIGTFVVNETKGSGDDQAGGQSGAPGEQLEAAIRAFRGPPQSAGIFGGGDRGTAAENNVGLARGNGLLSLFEPMTKSPPPAISLPKSTIPAPSLSSFSFSPPTASTSTSTSTSTSLASRGTRASTSTDAADGLESSQELTPLAIPPLVPTQTPRPPFHFSLGNHDHPGGGVDVTPSQTGGLDDMRTRGLDERKLEKKFLKRSTVASALTAEPPLDVPPGTAGTETGRSIVSASSASSSETTVKGEGAGGGGLFSIADLIDSLPTQVPPQPTTSASFVSRDGGADYSETQEFQSAHQSQSRLEYPPFSEDEDEDEDVTTRDGDEYGAAARANGGGSGSGFVPPSTMTLAQLKENGFVSSSEEDRDDTSSEDGNAEDEEEDGGGSIIDQSGPAGRHLGYSSEGSGSEDDVDSFQSVQARRRYRGPLQSSSNAPSSAHSSFATSLPAVPLPVPTAVPTLTIDQHLSPPVSPTAQSPPRSPFIENHSPVPPMASPLKLFQSTYDTYTRQHLNEIVDLVDSTTPAHDSVEDDNDWGHDREGERGGNSSEEGFLGGEGARRSCKRIKLSPPPAGERNRGRRADITARSDGEDEETEHEFEHETEVEPRRTRIPRTSSEHRRRRRDEGRANRRRGMFTVAAELDEESQSGSVGKEEDRHDRARDRREEAIELMEKIRKRSEERENRKRNDQPDTTNTRLALSPPKVSLASPRPGNNSPPRLPHLAAAASASIRSVLGSPAPSPRVPAMSPALVPTPQSHPQPTIGLGFDNKFPSHLVRGLESGGTIGGGRRISESSRPSPFLEASVSSPVPASTATPGHKRQSSLTTIHPSSLDAQRLLASVDSSVQAKGMVFDDKIGRWIRTPRTKRVVSRSSADERVAETVHEEEEDADEEEEEDPFKDFSELQSPPNARQSRSSGSPKATVVTPPPVPSQHSLSVPPATTSSTNASPGSTLSRADLDKLPHPGDGSGSLKLHQFDLSGLGISKGTPPLLKVPASSVAATRVKSPEGACYFDPPPAKNVEVGESPLLRLEDEAEEEEDSATWGKNSDGTDIDSRSQDEVGGKSPATPAHADQFNPIDARTRSAPRASNATPFPPRSALKPSRAQTEPTNFVSRSALAAATTATPIRGGFEHQRFQPPRSVSFSDGKTQGKIENVERWNSPTKSRFNSTFSLGGGFGELEMDEKHEQVASQEGDQEETASHPETVKDDTPRASRITNRVPSGETSGETSLVLSSFDSISPAVPNRSSTNTRSRTFSRTPGSRNATFLTECSFGVSHDRLLEFITDVEPFEPDWEGLTSIDLSRKKVESVVRLKEFLPKLDEVNLNDNELSYLTGIPSTLRTLLIASNRLTSLTSFHHLHLLERLDLSNNQLDSVDHLSQLRHLRDLKLDGNQVSSIQGLAKLDGLVRLSLKGNQFQGELDLGQTKWSRLETLVLARNDLSRVIGLEHLTSLTSINLDHNSLTSFAQSGSNPRLRILRLCNNPISHVDVAFAPKLRTLYVDSARLGTVEGTERLSKLENLSLRDQHSSANGPALTLSMPSIRDVRRLYLSGNPLLPSGSFPSEKFFNLTYLELAMSQLTSLPPDFAESIPNVRTLNLDFNFVESLEPLAGLTRLNRLSVVGARLSKVRPIVGVLETLIELESLDLRMNPITLAFYPPLGPATDSLLPSHSQHQILHPDSLPAPTTSSTSLDTRSTDFNSLDQKFRRALPDEWYFRRSAYRAALMHALPGLVRLDGIDCARERKKLSKVVDRLKE